jgi:protein phosphatase 1L
MIYLLLVLLLLLMVMRRRRNREEEQAVRGIGAAAIQGRRQYMEDTHTICSPLDADHHPHTHYAAVYDGHGGDKCSSILQTQLHTQISRLLHTHSIDTATRLAFKHTEQLVLTHPWNDGSTACVAIIRHNQLLVANVGDSRAVLARRTTQALQITLDHKPGDPHERQRLETLGANIIMIGVWRVEGMLALSRAFGDKHLKHFVTAEPDIFSREITEDDLVLIIATDGLWDVLSSQEAVDIVLKNDYQTKPQQVARMLTCLIIDLQIFSRNSTSEKDKNS